jgi:superfamily II DNA/RNA helicase
MSVQVAALHGELQASERGAIFEAARNGAFRLLLVSDLAARGLDMPQVRFKVMCCCSASQQNHAM